MIYVYVILGGVLVGFACSRAGRKSARRAPVILLGLAGVLTILGTVSILRKEQVFTRMGENMLSGLEPEAGIRADDLWLVSSPAVMPLIGLMLSAATALVAITLLGWPWKAKEELADAALIGGQSKVGNHPSATDAARRLADHGGFPSPPAQQPDDSGWGYGQGLGGPRQ